MLGARPCAVFDAGARRGRVELGPRHMPIYVRYEKPDFGPKCPRGFEAQMSSIKSTGRNFASKCPWRLYDLQKIAKNRRKFQKIAKNRK